ncbi:MAG: CDP-diacylglycerol--glycerol-3-phosphate 3-phosphatidyltransferase [Clostridia bacterium]|jgi:CDP-diacylglycerol--glycerol-3-phosphate 3-phosphatidyltransferase|nr:CDP-diacylglycerol--glycerol-3-phosphate 3-phosphatidyltransferase [Clostridia bacterium]
MNLPNKLSCLRLILIPVFTALFYLTVLPYNYLFALAVFAIASATDFLDGYIARKYHLVTNLGKFLDPIADKVLVSTALIVICAAEGALIPVVGPVCVAIILARELIISGFRQVAAKTGFVMAADKVGKIKTVTQDVAMIALMVYLEFPMAAFATEWLYYASNAVLILATVLTIVSGINYIVKNAAVLKDND